MSQQLQISTASEETLGINRNVAAMICLAGVFGILLIHASRTQPPPVSEMLRWIVDSGPNLLAAVCMPTAIPALAKLLTKRLPPLTPARWSLACFGVAQLGLLSWEFAQPFVRGMVFDIDDIGATIVGGVLWLVLANAVRVPQKNDS